MAPWGEAQRLERLYRMQLGQLFDLSGAWAPMVLAVADVKEGASADQQQPSQVGCPCNVLGFIVACRSMGGGGALAAPGQQGPPTLRGSIR